jgi:hypothetical membrane protein
MTPAFVSFWRGDIFRVIAFACVLFVVLTGIAMLFYPGGTVTDPGSAGYSFTHNFFSDLGRTASRTGQPNTVSLVLFALSMTLAGAALGVFFVAFTQFFRRNPAGRILSALAALFGVVSGVCFIGVGWAPGDVNATLHSNVTRAAFYLFPVAAIFAAAALFTVPAYPRRYTLVFGVFALLLCAYIGLLVLGPSARTAQGMVIQATGQKIIAYASIISIGLEAFGAWRYSQRA